MSVQHARTAEPLHPERSTPRGIAWWGMLIGVLILGTFLASLVASYLYLRSGAPEWPPAGVERPDITRPLIAGILVVVAAAMTSAGHRSMRRDRGAIALVGLTAAVLSAGAGTALHASELAGFPLEVGEHAYASMSWLLLGFELVLIGVGVLIDLVLIAQYAAGRIDVGRHQHLAVAALYWWFVAVTAAVVFATVTLLPSV